MHTAGPNALGYANTALVLALCHVLASKGVLTRDDLDDVLTDALGELDNMGDAMAVTRAMDLIKSFLPKIREHENRDRSGEFTAGSGSRADFHDSLRADES